MPLSEHEQRILRQIEQELASDPTFAERASRIPRRRLMWLALCLFLGLGLTIVAMLAHQMDVRVGISAQENAVTFWMSLPMA